MKSSLYIGIVLVLVAAGGYAVYSAMVEEASAPSDVEVDDGAGPAPGIASSDREALGAMLKSTEWLVVSDYGHAGLQERMEKADIALTPDETRAVLPLVAAHLKILRGNLEAAHRAAGEMTTRLERMRYVVAAAKAHGDLQRELKKIIPAEKAIALFNALPKMVPPSPAD